MDLQQNLAKNSSNHKLFFVYYGNQLLIRLNNYQTPQNFQSLHEMDQQMENDSSQVVQIKYMNAKSLQKNQNVKIFTGIFTYDTLPQRCNIWFGNVQELYEVFQDEQSYEVVKTIGGFTVKLKLQIKNGDRTFYKFFDFPLKQFYSEKEFKLEQLSEGNSKNEGKSVKVTNNNGNWQNQIYLKTELAYANSLKSNQIAQHLQQFVETFVDQIDLKWQRICDQMKAIKKNQAKLQNRIQKTVNKCNEYFNPNHERPLNFIKLSYAFSNSFKHQDIKLYSDNICKCFSKDAVFKIVLIEPHTFLTQKQPCKNLFQIHLQIKEFGAYIAFGICDKDTIKSMKFRSYETDVKHHGTYLIDWNGQTWSNYRSEDNNKKLHNFELHPQDIICFSFQTDKKLLKIWKKGKKKHETVMLINPSDQLSSLCFCVFLGGKGDSVQIIKDYDFQTEESEKICMKTYGQINSSSSGKKSMHTKKK